MTIPVRPITRAFTLALLVGLSASAQTPAGTAFTYQGRLTDAGSQANGSYDFEFRLFDAASGGNSVGAAVTQSNLPVTGGIFSVVLDFGASAFAGNARWLAVAVRPGGTNGGFTLVNPRHKITPVPYSLDAQHLGGQLPATYQNRVSGVCSSATVMRAVAVDGTVTCGQVAGADVAGAVPGNVTMAQLAAELGDYATVTQHNVVDGRVVTLEGQVDTLETRVTALEAGSQTRVSGTCSVGSSIRAIAANGTVTCEIAGTAPIPPSTAACTNSIAGTLRYSSGTSALQFCDGSTWLAVATVP